MTDELSKLFRDAMDWGRSYGQRLNTTYEVLDEVASQFADRARAIESAATKPLLERIAHLEATASANYGRGLKDGQTHAEERIADLGKHPEPNTEIQQP